MWQLVGFRVRVKAFSLDQTGAVLPTEHQACVRLAYIAKRHRYLKRRCRRQLPTPHNPTRLHRSLYNRGRLIISLSRALAPVGRHAAGYSALYETPIGTQLAGEATASEPGIGGLPPPAGSYERSASAGSTRAARNAG